MATTFVNNNGNRKSAYGSTNKPPPPAVRPSSSSAVNPRQAPLNNAGASPSIGRHQYPTNGGSPFFPSSSNNNTNNNNNNGDTLLNDEELERLQQRMWRRSTNRSALSTSSYYSNNGGPVASNQQQERYQPYSANPLELSDLESSNQQSSHHHQQHNTNNHGRSYSALPSVIEKQQSNNNNAPIDDPRTVNNNEIKKLHEKVEHLENLLFKANARLEATSNANSFNSNMNIPVLQPDVNVLNRRIDEQNARVASLEQALKVKESSIIHLSSSLENQLDTLQTYQFELSKMKVLLKNLTEDNASLRKSADNEARAVQKLETLRSEYESLKEMHEKKVTDLSEQVLVLTDRCRQLSSDLSEEVKKHEATKEKLSQTLERQIIDMSVQLQEASSGSDKKSPSTESSDGNGKVDERETNEKTIASTPASVTTPITAAIPDPLPNSASLSPIWEKLDQLEELFKSALPHLTGQRIGSVEVERSKRGGSGSAAAIRKLRDQVQSLRKVKLLNPSEQLESENEEEYDDNQEENDEMVAIENNEQSNRNRLKVKSQGTQSKLERQLRVATQTSPKYQSTMNAEGSSPSATGGAPLPNQIVTQLRNILLEAANDLVMSTTTSTSSPLTPNFDERSSSSVPVRLPNNNQVQASNPNQTSDNNNNTPNSIQSPPLLDSRYFTNQSNSPNSILSTSPKVFMTVLEQRKNSLESELLTSYAKFRDEEANHHRILQEKERALQETDRQLQALMKEQEQMKISRSVD